MFVAMNRFKIAPGKEAEFIEIWRNRETHLDQVPGIQDLQSAAGDRQRRIHALRVAFDLGVVDCYRKLDQIRGLPPGPCQCRHRQGYLSGPAAIPVSYTFLL